MKEIRNFKGEIVKTEAAYGERWWHLSSETWMFLSGIVILTVTLLLPAAWFNAALHSLDVRVWTWRHFVLAAAAAGYAAGCWHIRRSWDGYDEDEKRHAMSFVWFGLTLIAILAFLVILSMTGRLALFFRPVAQMFSVGRFTLAAVWRLALLALASVPLIHFGKEWILGFWNE